MNKVYILIISIIILGIMGIVFYYSVSYSESLTKIKPIDVVPKKSEVVLPYDELEAELIGYANQFIKRCKYVFEYDKAVACYMETESDDPLFLDVINNELIKKLVKNVSYEGNKVRYEWSDEYFEEKGKGCSKEEIKAFLKESGYKIKD